MPRSRRQESKPKVELVYEESSAIGTVAHRLIRLFPVQFGWTTSFKLGFLLVRGSQPKEGDRDVAGKFRKVPPIYHGLTGFDAVIEIHAWAWDRLTAEGQEALVAHELCHGTMSDRGTLRVVKHDLTEFHFVVGQYGAWAPDIARFREQLTLFDTQGGAYRAPTVVQPALVPDPEADAEADAAAAAGIAALEAAKAPRRSRSTVDQPPAPLN